jgi:hypothetical protein
MVITAGVALLVVGSFIYVDDDGGALVSRPWTRAELSRDGRVLTLWVVPPPDPQCEVFDHIELLPIGSALQPRAVYRQTPRRFCNVPCPLVPEPRTIELAASITGVRLLPSELHAQCGFPGTTSTTATSATG